MLIDISYRNAGKTTRAIHWAAKDENRWIIAHSNQAARSIVDLADVYGLKEKIIGRVISIHMYESGYLMGKGKAEILLDNADLILQWMFRNDIKGITLTQTSNKEDVKEYFYDVKDWDL